MKKLFVPDQAWKISELEIYRLHGWARSACRVPGGWLLFCSPPDRDLWCERLRLHFGMKPGDIDLSLGSIGSVNS